MKTMILKTASNYLLPLLLLFAVFILLRGHYLPGGGFVGGLVASIAFVLHGFANGNKETKLLLKYHPRTFMPVGLAMALVAAFLPMLQGLPILTALWVNEPIPIIGLIGSTLLFDTGVFLIVVGVALTILFTISESI